MLILLRARGVHEIRFRQRLLARRSCVSLSLTLYPFLLICVCGRVQAQFRPPQSTHAFDFSSFFLLLLLEKKRSHAYTRTYVFSLSPVQLPGSANDADAGLFVVNRCLFMCVSVRFCANPKSTIKGKHSTEIPFLGSFFDFFFYPSTVVRVWIDGRFRISLSISYAAVAAM